MALTSARMRMFADSPKQNTRPGRVLVIADIPRTARAVDAALEAARWPGASVVLVVRPSLWFGCALAWQSLAGVSANTSVDEFLCDEVLTLLRMLPAELPIEWGISRTCVRRRRLMEGHACDGFVSVARWSRRAANPGGHRR
jgi:hypothetical protein